MICSLGKLFYLKLPSNHCGGSVQKIGDLKDLSESVESLLFLNKCLGDKQGYENPPNKFDLLTNRLCPYNISCEALSNIDVCQTHYVSIFNG